MSLNTLNYIKINVYTYVYICIEHISIGAYITGFFMSSQKQNFVKIIFNRTSMT